MNSNMEIYLQEARTLASIILSKRIFFFTFFGLIAYHTHCHVFSKKQYKKFVIKVFGRVVKFCKWKPKDPEYIKDCVEHTFFDADNVECRKHVVRRSPCHLPDCSFYKLQYILDLLNNSEQTIDLCMYLITCTDLASALIKAHKRGIAVRVIVEEEMSTSSESKVQTLIHAGIPVRSKVLPTFMHHKFCIVDGTVPFKRKLLTGSLNWTLQGLAGNWENIILIREKTVVLKYHEEFECIWEYFVPKQLNSNLYKRTQMRKMTQGFQNLANDD